MIFETSINSWHSPVNQKISNSLISNIESGHVLFFPQLPFTLLSHEHKFLSPSCADPRSKNISFDPQTACIRGSTCKDGDVLELKDMMARFAQNARTLVDSLFPHYQPAIVWGKTSYRCVEAMGRKVSSYRKDDTRLHVDAFASTPVQGLRLLRVFSNINPHQPRIWNLGEPFEDVAKRFLPKVSQTQWIPPQLLQKLGITKGQRSRYDHIMLQIHNAMKHDKHYQKIVSQQEMAFPAGSTWVVMTDQVSHAALSGQFLLEQTFYLPPAAMKNPEQSPLRVLERLTGKTLIAQP